MAMFDKFVKDIKDFKASVLRFISPGGIIMSGVGSSFHFDFKKKKIIILFL